MIKLSFFLMTKKGLDVIKAFVEKNGVSSVLYVVGSKDSNVTKDYFDEIRNSNGVVVHTPARISQLNGRIEISAKQFREFTIPMRMAILLH